MRFVRDRRDGFVRGTATDSGDVVVTVADVVVELVVVAGAVVVVAVVVGAVVVVAVVVVVTTVVVATDARPGVAAARAVATPSPATTAPTTRSQSRPRITAVWWRFDVHPPADGPDVTVPSKAPPTRRGVVSPGLRCGRDAWT